MRNYNIRENKELGIIYRFERAKPAHRFDLTIQNVIQTSRYIYSSLSRANFKLGIINEPNCVRLLRAAAQLHV